MEICLFIRYGQCKIKSPTPFSWFTAVEVRLCMKPTEQVQVILLKPIKLLSTAIFVKVDRNNLLSTEKLCVQN